jgi:hypothetical protein
MVRPERFELPTYCSGGNRSIHLSYGRLTVDSVYMGSWEASTGVESWRFNVRSDPMTGNRPRLRRLSSAFF